MNNTTDPAALAECVALLDDEDREVLHRYWDRVIEEAWSAVPVHPVLTAVPLAELDERRRRRQARWAMAQVAPTGSVVAIHVRPDAGEAA
ncbi:MAG: hypothetical protein AB7L91_18565 [Dehalococcoidia bacterium]